MIIEEDFGMYILLMPMLKHIRPHGARNHPPHRPQRAAA